jgi:hypothetical protein
MLIKKRLKRGIYCMNRNMFLSRCVTLVVCLILAVVTPFSGVVVQAHSDPPEIWLPMPVGEDWKVIQGYKCGTHEHLLKLDLARTHGSTVGAPVRAAADGTVHFWTGGSGTLILNHGNGYYTQYTHITNPFSTRGGTQAYQGQVIGYVNGIAHLDFSLYYSPSGSHAGRTTLPLHFADGYSFPELSGCNQHFGKTMVARENPDTTPPDIQFATDAEPEQWYCEDKRIEFQIHDDRQILGFSQACNEEPTDETPAFEADTGFMQLAPEGEGMHTFYVRAWDQNNNQVVATFGPVGYDTTAPTLKPPTIVLERTYRASEDNTIHLSWPEASDGDGSGVAGYHYYFGTDLNGTSDAFSEYNGVQIAQVEPGCYVLRVQAIDKACGKSDWITMEKVRVANHMGQMPSGMCHFDGQGISTENPPILPPDDASDSPAPEQPSQQPAPTDEPTAEPTQAPSPTAEPTDEPTQAPSPTAEPTDEPTQAPSPTAEPTDEPTEDPTEDLSPTVEEVLSPTVEPTEDPTEGLSPTVEPTDEPAEEPTEVLTPTV